MEVERFQNEEDLAQAAAEFVVSRAGEAVHRSGKFTLALTGGQTPRRLYELLARPPLSERIPWTRVHFFWGDERCVPPDHKDSNYNLAYQALLSLVPALPENIHRMPGEVTPPDQGAVRYEQDLWNFFDLAHGHAFPGFDLTILGLGTDGHTASLFPESEALYEARPWVTSAFPPPDHGPAVPRLTLTFPALNASKAVLFLVTGAAKRPAAKKIIEDPALAARRYPAARIQPRGRLYWFLDAAAY